MPTQVKTLKECQCPTHGVGVNDMEQHDVTECAPALCQSHRSLNPALTQAAYLGQVTSLPLFRKAGPLPLQRWRWNKGETKYVLARGWPATTHQG